MTANPFAPAAKEKLKARVALCGPTGSGKTWTGLQWCQVLAQGGPIAVIDTEDSAAYYADTFAFDVMVFNPPYEPARLVALLNAAAANGYAVVLIDSLSHFWEGEGGTLDIADAAGQRSGGGNSFAGWKVATPALRNLIDTITRSPLHVIATMRSKMEYVLEQGKNGKQVPRKVGMAPVMRAGVEYEFTVVGDLDFEHRLAISKSRCSALADLIVQPNRAPEAAETFLAWLNSGIDAPERPAVAPESPPAPRHDEPPIHPFVELGWRDKAEHDAAKDSVTVEVASLPAECKDALRKWWADNGYRYPLSTERMGLWCAEVAAYAVKGTPEPALPLDPEEPY